MSRRGENIYKRKDGRWEGRYIKSYTADNRAKYGYVYGKTYSDVKEKLISAKAVPIRSTPECKLKTISLNEVLTLWLLSVQRNEPFYLGGKRLGSVTDGFNGVPRVSNLALHGFAEGASPVPIGLALLQKGLRRVKDRIKVALMVKDLAKFKDQIVFSLHRGTVDFVNADNFSHI